MTPLIMVISFSDSMQLTFAARDRLLAGVLKRDAFRNAILVVGPACVLTHSTAGLSFIALLFSSSDLIRKFGEAGIIATATALLAVLILVPLLGILLVRENKVALVTKAPDVAVDVLRRFCRWIATRMIQRAGLYTLLNVVKDLHSGHHIYAVAAVVPPGRPRAGQGTGGRCKPPSGLQVIWCQPNRCFG